MRVEFRHEMNERQNLGVGDLDLQDRAYDRTTTENALRFSLNGLLLPKVANELKVQYSRDVTEQSSLSNEPAIVVLDNFSSGGAGQQSNRRGRLLEIEDNIDFQIGKKHRMRTGFLLEGMWYRSDELRNGNGTWTFGGLDAVRARPGRPPTRSASARRWWTTASIRRRGTSRTTTRRSRSCRSASGCGTRCSRTSTTSGTSRRAWASPGRPASTPCAAATASSTTGTSRASTSRRCGSTA